jgi:hypothetical protein
MEIIFAHSRTQALGKYFLRKIKNPLFADGPVMRPSAKWISKTVNFTPVNGYFFGDAPQ